MYTTLSPCMMCSGTIIQFRIPRVVIGDAVNFGGNEGLLREREIQSIMDIGLHEFLQDFISQNSRVAAEIAEAYRFYQD